MSAEPILLDQLDYFGLIASDEFFGTIKVLRQNKGVVAADIDQALSVLLEEGDKIGACVVVLMPELQPDPSEGQTPRYFNRIAVQVIVQPLIADDVTSGAGVTAEAVAERIRQICHGRHFGRANEFMFDGMEPIPQEPGKVSYGVYFRRVGGDRWLPKVAAPAIAADAGEVTLSCATSGAAIRYTTDGSAPYSANPAAVLYTDSFTVAEDCTVRAAASKTGMQASEITQEDVEAAASISGENEAEVVMTTADRDQVADPLNPAKEILRIAVPPGSYSVAGILAFSLVEYLQTAGIVGFRVDVGDPLGVQAQQTVWSGENVAYNPAETSSGHGGAYGDDPQYAMVECTSGFLALLFRSPAMNSGSIVFAPGGVTMTATPVP